MNRVINKIKNSKGFVSLEFIMIAGVVILLAGLIIAQLRDTGHDIANDAVTELSGSADETIQE